MICLPISGHAVGSVRPVTSASQPARDRWWRSRWCTTLVLAMAMLASVRLVVGVGAVAAPMVDGALGPAVFEGPGGLPVEEGLELPGAAVAAGTVAEAPRRGPVSGSDVASVAGTSAVFVTLARSAAMLADPDRTSPVAGPRVAVHVAALGFGAQSLSWHSGPRAVLRSSAGSSSGAGVAAAATGLADSDGVAAVGVECRAAPMLAAARPLVRPG